VERPRSGEANVSDPQRTFSASRAPGRLERRLASLRTLEWVNIGWLAFVLLWWIPTGQSATVPAGTWQRTVTFVPLAILLAVGGWYWHRKLQQLRDSRPLDDALAVLDRADRYARLLLTVTTATVALSWFTATGSAADRVWASLFVVFAWAEYVNYFRLQLMHDTRSDLSRLRRTRRLRRSWLATDLAHWRANQVVLTADGDVSHR
jgi:hypothetical protein